jgi:hypothetical protein
MMRALRQKRRQNGRERAFPAFAEVRSLMEYELARARRYERPLSLVAVEPETLRLARFPLRFADLFAETPDGSLVLMMLPETGADGALALAQRLQGPDVAADDLRVASFPDDGVTLDDLVRAVLTPAGATLVAAS